MLRPLLPLALVLLVVGCESEPDIPVPPGSDAVAEDTMQSAPEAGDPLFGNAFAPVCRGSTGLPAAAEYVEGSGLHPFVLMRSDDGVEYSASSVGTFPEGWRVTWPDLADAQLVVCAERVSATPAQVCEGYEDEDTGTTWTVQTHDVVYEYTVRVAQKGDVLGTQTFEVAAGRCPMFSSYREGDPDPKPYYRVPSAAEIEVFVRPFVTGR